MNPIYAEQVALKLAALKNLQAPNFAAAVAKEPRQPELCWFLQSASMQPGGLDKFCQNLLALFPERLGTADMLAIGKTDEPYTAAERQKVLASFPEYLSDNVSFDESKRDKATALCDAILSQVHDEMQGSPEYGSPFRSSRRRPDLAFVNRQNHAYFFDYCRKLALAELPWKICQFLTQPDDVLKSPFYFTDLPGALLEMLDVHAARHFQNIAMTKVASESFDALEFAIAERAMVEITGDSRFGKTEAVKTWCNANPGKARLVKTPPDTGERSFFDAIAESAGCNVTFESSLREVKAKVTHVLKHSGLMLVFDEAAWLLPTHFTSRTTPVRLNYIRSLALDNGCPVALIVTPQFYDRAANKFEKVTGFNMAQFKGRIMRKVTLPAELSDADLLAVVNIHFPDLKESYAKRIVAAALMSESYLFAVEKISKNARAVAKKNGHAAIELEDLETGIALAGINAPSISARPAPVAAPALRLERSRPSAMETRNNKPAPLTSPARAITPEMEHV